MYRFGSMIICGRTYKELKRQGMVIKTTTAVRVVVKGDGVNIHRQTFKGGRVSTYTPKPNSMRRLMGVISKYPNDNGVFYLT